MKPEEHNDPLGEFLQPFIRQSEKDISNWLVEAGTPDTLADAVRYCTDGGKRLRPAMVFLAAEAVGGRMGDELTRRAAVAVELVHCYSLVHDDLPAMDNDELRRGLPTAHVKFGQAMAILAGDALLTRAFGVLGEYADPRCGWLIAELASAAGQCGMIAGQAADMKLCTIPGGLEGLNYIHLRKTAAMIRAAARMGAICGGANPVMIGAVSDFGESLGLAFQLVDDLLDVVGSKHEMGKAVGKDADAGKITHASVVGVEKARIIADGLTQAAIDSLRPLGKKSDKLIKLAEMLVGRRR